jgi:hypothetical protein
LALFGEKGIVTGGPRQSVEIGSASEANSARFAAGEFSHSDPCCISICVQSQGHQDFLLSLLVLPLDLYPGDGAPHLSGEHPRPFVRQILDSRNDSVSFHIIDFPYFIRAIDRAQGSLGAYPEKLFAGQAWNFTANIIHGS